MLDRLQDSVLVQKLAVFLLLSGLALLLIEIRFEHQVVLAKKWQAWIPLVYTTGMITAGGIGLCFWEAGGRKLLVWGFSIGVIIGMLGFWFHGKGQPLDAILQVLKVICMSPGRVVTYDLGPPVLAPLAMVGLGLLGVILCAQKHHRIQSEDHE
jgi:hypothetical protein